MKRLLNRQANILLGQLGHSEWMVQHAKRELWWWLRARAEAAVKRRRLLQGAGIVWTGAGRTELLKIEVPVAGPGEVTVVMAFTSVSPGTERAQYLGLPNAKVMFPFQPGYSGSGIVINVGGGVDDLMLGDRVAVIGGTHSSLVTIPARRALRIPIGVDLSASAMVTLGVIAQQGIRAGGVRSGDAVCVIGSGVVGALAQRLAIANGAESVVAVARTRRHEAVARAGGAAEFVCLEEDGYVPRKSARVTIDATGDPEALAHAISATEDGGNIVVLGSPRGPTRAFPLDELRSGALTIVGAHIGTLQAEEEITGEDAHAREGNAFLNRLAQDPSLVDDLISDRIEPTDAAVFYRELARGRPLGVAQFEWAAAPSDTTVGPARLFRFPDVRARGLELDRPLELPISRRPTADTRPAITLRAAGTLRVGLLGCGDIGTHNAAAVAAAPNARLVACYDPLAPLAEDMARQHSVDAARSLEDFLARNDIDAVFVSVPHHLHAPLAEAAAAAGKHLIVEKPLANTLAGAQTIVEAARQAGVFLTICFPHRYDPHVEAARRLAIAGALGEFRGALVQLFIDKPASYWWGGFSGRAPSNWRASRDAAGGGVLIMNLSHYIDLIRFLVEVEPALIASSAGFEEGMEVEESVSVSVQYENGAIGCLVSSAAIPGIYSENHFRLWGTDGTLEVEPDARAFSLRSVDGMVPSRWLRIGASDHAGSRVRFINSFANAVARGAAPDIGPEDALAAQAFVEAAYRSLDEGRSISPAELLRPITQQN